MEVASTHHVQPHFFSFWSCWYHCRHIFFFMLFFNGLFLTRETPIWTSLVTLKGKLNVNTVLEKLTRTNENAHWLSVCLFVQLLLFLSVQDSCQRGGIDSEGYWLCFYIQCPVSYAFFIFKHCRENNIATSRHKLFLTWQVSCSVFKILRLHHPQSTQQKWNGRCCWWGREGGGGVQPAR